MTTAASISAKLILDSTDYESGLHNAQRATQTFESKLSGIGSKLSSIGRTMSVAFTVPIVAGATAAGKAFIDLDTQMKNIQSISQQSDESLEVLRQKFISMSTDLNVTRDSATELAEGFYFIQSSGFAGAEGMQVLEAATRAATAGLTNTMTAGNAILATLNAYGMGADQAEHVSDVLFKTVDLGVLTFEDLAHQLGDVVNTAAMTSVPIEDVGAALALMTRKGVSTAESVTALNQLLLQFISPSSKMKKQAKEWGIDMSVATLRTYGLAGALDLILKQGGPDALLTLFGDNVRALKGALTLGGEGLGEFNEMQKQFADVSGRTQQAFETQNKSAAAQIDNFKNKITALGITLAGIFIPILIQLLDIIKPVIDWLQNASPATQKWIVIILLLLAVIGPLLLILGSLATAISAVIGLIGLITLPVLLIILVIGLLIAALVLLYFAWKNNWWGIRDITTEAWTNIKTLIQSGIQWISDFFSGKLGDWSVMFTNTWNHLKLIVQTALLNFQLIFKAFAAAFNGDWYAFGMYIRMAWNNIWTLLVQTVKVSWQNMVHLASMIVQGIWHAFMSIDWQHIGANIGNGILNGLKAIGDRIVQTARNIAHAVSQAWAGFWGIHSPSSLAEYYALMVGAGWRKGLMGQDWSMQPALSTIPSPTATVSPLIAAAQPSQQGNQNSTQSSFDYQLLARVLATELAKQYG